MHPGSGTNYPQGQIGFHFRKGSRVLCTQDLEVTAVKAKSVQFVVSFLQRLANKSLRTSIYRFESADPF